MTRELDIFICIEVETDCSDRLHLVPPNRGRSSNFPPPWHARAGGGAVHSITTRLMQCNEQHFYFDHARCRLLSRFCRSARVRFRYGMDTHL